MIPAMYSLYSAINGSYRSASLMFGASQQQMDLANSVTSDMTPNDIQQTFDMDKALALQSAYAKVMFSAYQIMQEDAAKQLKKEFEFQRKTNQIWYS